MTAAELGELMRNAREDSDLSQRKVAAALYVDLRTVQKWEHGVCLPNVLMLSRFLNLVRGSITLGVKR